MVSFGLINLLRLVIQRVHLTTATCFLKLSGKCWPANLRLPEVMTPVIQLYYKLPGIVLATEPSDQRSQVMETSSMVQCGQVINAVEVVELVTVEGTEAQQVLNSTVVAATFRAEATLGFGVIGIVAMAR